jgi:hypothetical protein
MRHDRLKLVIPKDDSDTATDSSTELLAVPATPDSCVRRLGVADADQASFPDDAA